MGDKTDSSTQLKTLHPAYTVTDIQRKVRVLDGVKVSYSSWVKLFQLHARGYKVMEHIDGTRTPAKDDPAYTAWSEIDAIVLQWIYGTLSDDLLVRVLDNESTAYDAWNRIKAIFLNNKGARAAALEHEFSNLTLKAMPSLEAYCQKIKDLGDQLKDVDSPVNEQRLVLQLVRGLPAEYDVVGAYINQTIPSWETACSMLQLEHQRQTARQSLTLPAALATVTNETPRHDIATRRRGQNRPNATRRDGSRGRGHFTSTGQWPTTDPRQPPFWAYWAPPPCPYPTHPGWAQPWQAKSAPQARKSGPQIPYQNATQAHLAEVEDPTNYYQAAQQADPLQPTQLQEAMQALNVTSGDDQWYMDSGASDHFTGNQGKITSPLLSCSTGSIFVGNGEP